MAYTTIDKSTDHFNTKLWTGTGSSNALTGVGFQPGWTWIKQRSGTENHNLFDAVRGVTKRISSNRNNAEDTQAQQLTAFGSDGFTVGTDNGANQNSQTYVAWNWKAGTTSGLSGGSLTPSAYSINATAGFGIYKYTGTGYNATIAHGLGKVPRMIMIKKLDGTTEWQIYHAVMGNTKFIELTGTAAQQRGTTSIQWQNTTPTSTLFYLGTEGDVNASGSTFIAYVFCDVPGFCKIGNYHGNGQNDGSFIYTGFKPKFIIIKSDTRTSSWDISDFERIGYNPKNYRLTPHNTAAAYTGQEIYKDYLSNGFKIRASDTDTNEDGRNYFYMAFGQSLVGSNNVPCTAR